MATRKPISTEETDTTESVVEIKTQKPKKVFKEFLENRKVKIVPIKDASQWKNRAGGETDRIIEEAFRVPGTSRKLDIPFSGKLGGHVRLFDNSERHFTRDYPDEELTEQEYFERKLGQDLSPESKFLVGSRPNDKDKKIRPLRVSVPETGLTLDLTTPLHYLFYKICLANTQTYLAPSKEESYDIPSYWCYISDERVENSKATEDINLEMKAMKVFSEIEHSRELLIQVLLCADPTNPPSWKDNTESLRLAVWNILKNSPKYFIELGEDPYKEEKLLIFKAVKQGIINKPYMHKYETAGGEDLGNLDQLIHLLLDRNRLEFRVRLEEQTKNTEI